MSPGKTWSPVLLFLVVSIKDDGQVNAEQKRDTGHVDDTSSSKGPVVYQRKKKKLDSIKDDGQ
ncbi:hypothetical protein Tco_0651285, partial [Tanacetum coccineum]